MNDNNSLDQIGNTFRSWNPDGSPHHAIMRVVALLKAGRQTYASIVDEMRLKSEGIVKKRVETQKVREGHCQNFQKWLDGANEDNRRFTSLLENIEKAGALPEPPTAQEKK